MNFLSFCSFAFTRTTALLTELYWFNPKFAPTLISGSARMDRIKSMCWGDDQSFATTKNEFVGFMLGEYDFYDRFFAFGRPAMDWDTPRDIDFRIYPAAGVGYRFFQKEQNFIQLPVGLGYVYENFDGFGTNSYFSWYIGLGGGYDFGKGIYLDVDFLYMPSIAPFADDWLFRSFLDFTVPLFDPIALKLLLTNVNDDNPSPEVGNNKFTATMALSLEF